MFALYFCVFSGLRRIYKVTYTSPISQTQLPDLLANWAKFLGNDYDTKPQIRVAEQDDWQRWMM